MTTLTKCYHVILDIPLLFTTNLIQYPTPQTAILTFVLLLKSTSSLEASSISHLDDENIFSSCVLHKAQRTYVIIERSFGEPMCLCKYAIRNKTGNQKKICTE